jgi:hypothetical protein
MVKNNLAGKERGKATPRSLEVMPLRS